MYWIEKGYSWRAHPARERIGAAVAALVVVFAIAIVIYVSFQSLAWSILAVILLLLALNRFYFPSRFVIDRKEITAHYPLARQKYQWTDIRRFSSDRYGGYLSRRKRSSRLDVYRGMNILFGDQREVVIKLIRKLISEAEHR